MRVIKGRQAIEDGWELAADGGALPPSGDVIVSVEAWNAHHAAGRPAREGQLGVLLRSHERPERVEGLEHVTLVAVEFPKFGDGRGYSIARTLRDQLRYRGELRAVGNVLRDQLFYMARCGFDSFALQPGKDIVGALAAFEDFSVTYQAAADEPLPLYRRVQR